jgi:hypothetical protein
MGTPYRNGDPGIVMGRDLSIFQIRESQNRYGVHSNLGTNTYTKEGDFCLKSSVHLLCDQI